LQRIEHNSEKETERRETETFGRKHVILKTKNLYSIEMWSIFL
jgi:hypothetical protein